MNIVHKKYVNTVIIVASTIIGIVLGYFILVTSLKWLLPFILAYAIAHISDPVVTFMENKMKVPRRLASAITILSVLLLIGTLIAFIVYRIIYEIKKLAERVPDLFNIASDKINELFDKGVTIYVNLPLEVTQFIDQVIDNLSKNLTDLLKPATQATTKFAYNFATSLPTILIFIIVLFLSAYFMSSDKKKIAGFIKKQLPDSWTMRIIAIKNDLLFALLGYIKAQLILMSITFVEVAIFFLILRVDYAILLALLIGFIDALPILGTGTILIPWALYSLITGNYPFALSLLIVYGFALLVRQLLEPKIVSGQIGLYPLVTLVSMYIGLQLFGIIGMILGPITVIVLRNLQKADLLKIWKE